MANLSINAAWNEASAFVRREARLLFPVAFLLVALPSGLLQLVMPPAPAPGQAAEPGMWMLFIPIAVILGMIGSLALTVLALRQGVSVAEALQHGARRFLPLLGATILVAIGAVLLLLPLILLLGIAGAAMGVGGAAPSAGAIAGGTALMALVFALVAIALWTRLMLMTPVAAAEPAGPVAIIRRSWDLTRGHFWQLLGFVLLVLVVFIIVSAVTGALGGLVIVFLAGPPDPGSLSFLLVVLIGIAVNMVLTVYFVAMATAIYRQLSGSGTQDVFA